MAQWSYAINLSSDTPDRTREAAGHGAAFLTGGVMASAPMVGAEASYVHYSGPEQVMERHRPALTPIGTPKYLGTDPGLAQMMHQARLAVFLTALSSLMHATAMPGSAGLKAADVLPELIATADSIGEMLRAGEESPGTALDAGEHPGDLSTVTMMGATSDHIVASSAAIGLASENRAESRLRPRGLTVARRAPAPSSHPFPTPSARRSGSSSGPTPSSPPPGRTPRTCACCPGPAKPGSVAKVPSSARRAGGAFATGPPAARSAAGVAGCQEARVACLGDQPE